MTSTQPGDADDFTEKSFINNDPWRLPSSGLSVLADAALRTTYPRLLPPSAGSPTPFPEEPHVTSSAQATTMYPASAGHRDMDEGAAATLMDRLMSSDVNAVTTAASLERLNQRFNQLTTGDSSLAPSRFSGSKRDIENVDTWLRYFQNYITFRNMTEHEALNLFRLLMTDLAAEWMANQPSRVLSDFTRMMDAFTERFALNRMQKVQKAVDVWHRTQQPGESVDAYISDVRKLARQGGLADEQQISTAIIRGLKLNIRLHVLTHCKDGALNEIIDAARTAEAALALAPDSTDQAVTELSKTVAILVEKLAAKESASTSNQTSTTTTVTPTPTPHISAMSERQYQDGYYQHQQQRPQQQRQYNDRRFGQNQRQRGGILQRGGRQQRPFSVPPQQTGSYRPAYNAERSCGNCGRQHTQGICAARGNQCYACGKYGHFARCCRSSPPNNTP